MKNLSARYRLQLVDRGLLGFEGIDECLPCIYKKKKWHIEKKTSMQYKSNNGINVIFSTSVSFIYYNACIFFFLKKQWKFWPNIIYLSTQWFAHSTGMQVTTQTKAINWTNQPLCQYL